MGCLDLLGINSESVKKETFNLATLASKEIFNEASAEDRLLYIESDSDFQININTLGNIDVKRMSSGTKFLKAIHFSGKISITSIEITNPGSEEISVNYILA